MGGQFLEADDRYLHSLATWHIAGTGTSIPGGPDDGVSTLLEADLATGTHEAPFYSHPAVKPT
ncbi:MAG: hypothetical protein EA364_14490 [Balneolaceae bacterium]|nr:MAG: hypothetical protein EA364_14490 [Balneolaceae bacterium]